MLYDSQKEIHENLTSNHIQESESVVSEAGGVSSVTNSWSFWVESIVGQNPEYVNPEIEEMLQPDPPRDFKFSRMHGDKSQSFSSDPNEFCPAIEAAKFVKEGIDMRPHLYQPNTDQYYLIDSGAQVCTVPPDPGDQVDPTMALRAVNGARIKCYGTKVIYIKINRKSYPIKVIKSDVQSPILGWNFIRLHKFSFDWNFNFS